MLVEERPVDDLVVGGVLLVGLTDAWLDEIAAFIGYLRAAGMSGGTIALKAKHIRRLGQGTPNAIGPWDVTEDDLMAFMGCDTWAPESRKSMRSSLRSFYQWGVYTRRTTEDVTLRLPSVKVPEASPRPTPDTVFHAAYAAADDRAQLMILLAAHAGLRRAEIAGLHTSNVVGGQLRVKGKGGKTRTIPLHPEILERLVGLPDGYVFPGNDGGHLSPDRVGRIIGKVLGKGWTAHTLRHRFATKAYAAEKDLFTVQRLLGHSRSDTTQRYTATTDESALAAVMAS